MTTNGLQRKYYSKRNETDCGIWVLKTYVSKTKIDNHAGVLERRLRGGEKWIMKGHVIKNRQRKMM